MTRFLCWLLGHRGPPMWWNPDRMALFGNLSSRAGLYAMCSRCGAAAYDDLGHASSSAGRDAQPVPEWLRRQTFTWRGA